MPTDQTATDNERDRLIKENIDLPRAIARRRFSQGAVSHRFEDIVADGYTGLVEAANTFDPSRGAPFRAFASLRIRGAIFDGGRRVGRYSRGHYAELKAQDAKPDGVHVAIDTVTCELKDESQPDIDEAIDRRRTFDRALERIAKLPERERKIVQSHYFSGRSIQETAVEIGQCEFTTSRIHARMIRRLRRALAPCTFATEQP